MSDSYECSYCGNYHQDGTECPTLPKDFETDDIVEALNEINNTLKEILKAIEKVSK